MHQLHHIDCYMHCSLKTLQTATTFHPGGLIDVGPWVASDVQGSGTDVLRSVLPLHTLDKHLTCQQRWGPCKSSGAGSDLNATVQMCVCVWQKQSEILITMLACLVCDWMITSKKNKPCQCGSCCEYQTPQCKHRTTHHWQEVVLHCLATTIFHLEHCNTETQINTQRDTGTDTQNRTSFIGQNHTNLSSAIYYLTLLTCTQWQAR